MRKLLLMTTALVAFTLAPDRAEAEPVTLAIAAAFNVAAGTAAFAVIQGVVALTVSYGIGLLQASLQKKPKGEVVRSELTRPTSLPAYRFVYGKTWAPGTPVAFRVQGRHLYICYLLNSRPSAGPFKVIFDNRPVDKAGDEFDFGPSGGAVGTNHPFSISLLGGLAGPAQMVTYWIGRGDQTSPPAAVVAETQGHFTDADAWRGRTVLWARLNCGRDEGRQERWPVSPPALNVDGNWSLVMDPRDGQEKFTRNQGLIVLDALRNNPLRPYADSYLDLRTFEWAANVAGQPVAVKGGGSIPRYACDGVLVFSDGSEIEDQIEPLMAAGAARFARIGGKLAIVPGIARDSVKTVSDFTDGQPVDLVRWRSSDDLYTEAVARFLAPDRAYESAETPAYVVPGAQAEDGGAAKRLVVDLDFVTDHRQAQRLAVIAVRRSRMQRQVSCELFPDCFNLVSGSVCELDLPAPYSGWNRKYEVASIAPAAGLNDDASVTVRLPTVLTETSDAIWTWVAATDEQDMQAGDLNPVRGRVLPPPLVSVVSGTAAARTSGDTVVPGVIAAWQGSGSASANSYNWEWQTRPLGGDWGLWQSGGSLALSDADGLGVYSAAIEWPQTGAEYRVRVQTVGTWGRSEWAVSSPIEAAGPAALVDTPPAPTATAQGVSRINIVAAQAADNRARKLLIYGNDVDSALTAVLLVSVDAGASATVTRSETGLPSGGSRFYFTRARDQWGNLSGFSESGTATTA